MKALFDAGVPTTIGTDDPMFFGTTPADEYARLYDLGFSDRDLRQMLENGYRQAFLAREEIGRYVDSLRSAWSQLSPATLTGQ